MQLARLKGARRAQCSEKRMNRPSTKRPIDRASCEVPLVPHSSGKNTQLGTSEVGTKRVPWHARAGMLCTQVVAWTFKGAFNGDRSSSSELGLPLVTPT